MRLNCTCNKNFHQKFFDGFNIFPQNIDCGSNEYPQSMFWITNNKNRYTPVNPNFTI